jgi:hypothetical protein
MLSDAACSATRAQRADACRNYEAILDAAIDCPARDPDVSTAGVTTRHPGQYDRQRWPLAASVTVCATVVRVRCAVPPSTLDRFPSGFGSSTR